MVDAERPSQQAPTPYFLNNDGSRPKWFAENGKFNPYDFDPLAPYIPKGETFSLPSNPEKQLENPFDLKNLRFIDPEQVKNTLTELEMKYQEGKPCIVAIGTGGTIASEKTEEGSYPRLNMDFLMEYAGRFIKRDISYSSLAFPAQMNSSQMTLDYDADMVIAMSWMWSNMKQEMKRNFLGFMVTHGTDTMAESATRMAMMLGPNQDFSVGITGSQISIDNPYNDVQDNITRCIASMDALGQASRHTTFLYMGGSEGGAMNPAGTRKISDTLINGFLSPAIPKILDASNVRNHQKINHQFLDVYSTHRSPQKDDFQPTVVRGTTISRIINARMDMNPDEVKKMIKDYDENVRAIILETYGTFTVERRALNAIMEAAKERNLSVFAASPFATGLGDLHSDIDSKYMVLDNDVIPVTAMPHAIEAKILVGDAIYGKDKETFEKFIIDTNYIGEQPPHWVHWNESQTDNPNKPLRTFGRSRATLFPGNLDTMAKGESRTALPKAA